MNTRPVAICLMLLLFSGLAAKGPAARAQEEGGDMPTAAVHPVSPAAVHGSGLPLPRFASLRSDKTHARSGPGARYPIKWVYNRAGLPVEIVQEFENWRKIRDFDGDEGWVNQLLLSGKRTAQVKGEVPAALHGSHSADSRVTARLAPRVIAEVKKCEGAWCRVSAGGYDGWIERNFLWGIYAREDLN
jgi:SH3-like domain-containing protein